MAKTDTIPTRGHSDEARYFMIGPLTIVEPFEGQTIELISKAMFEFEIIQIHHRLSTATLDATFTIDGTIVEFESDNSAGGALVNSDLSIESDAGPLDSFSPNGSDSGNYTVLAPAALADRQKLQVILTNVASNAEGYVLQIDCQRTRLNTL